MDVRGVHVYQPVQRFFELPLRHVRKCSPDQGHAHDFPAPSGSCAQGGSVGVRSVHL